jgi:predicted nucleotidyltransferase
MDWWGYSKEHGWVVLDRTVETKSTGPNEQLEFFRFRDGTTFLEMRKNWNPPAYTFAPNYIRNLPPEQAAEAGAAWADAKARWPELQRALHQQTLDAAAKAEAERVALELAQKKAAREKKKQVGLAT